MTKRELGKDLIRSFPIYELLQIRIEGHRYPRRRICQQRLGFFDTKEHAEESMHSTIEFYKKVCKNYYDDCFGFFLLEQFVHNRGSSFYWNERHQKCFSFNADGKLNDFVALDELGLYHGRKQEDIRFKVGDIVEAVDGKYSDLGIVGALPLTTDTYHQMEDDPGEGGSHKNGEFERGFRGSSRGFSGVLVGVFCVLRDFLGQRGRENGKKYVPLRPHENSHRKI